MGTRAWKANLSKCSAAVTSRMKICVCVSVNVRDERHRGEGQRGKQLYTEGAYMSLLYFATLTS